MKTTKSYWDAAWQEEIRYRLPRNVTSSARNLQRLLRQRIKPGMRVLEIGFAPGKMLAWVAKILQAKVAGIDYSDRGFSMARRLFDVLHIDADLRHEDVFAATFDPGSFDVVYSNGVIEHFDDPTEMVRRHVVLLKPGGFALIAIPNYGGIYGRLQGFFDPGNLKIHNLDIMNPEALDRLAPLDLVSQVRTYPTGRISPWLINFDKRWPRLLALALSHMVNLAGLMQPLDWSPLCPMLMLELRRNGSTP